MHLRAGKFASAAVVAMLLAGTSAGCAFPDRWAIFEKQLRGTPAPESSDAHIDLPDRYRPRRAADPAAPATTQPSGTMNLSVEQATMLVLRNNRDLDVQVVGPLIAGAFEQIERGVFDPELFAELQYGREVATETSRSTSDQFSVEGHDTEAAVGVRQRLPTGTDVELEVSNTRSISNRAPELQQGRVGLTITQSLLRGFGPAVNLARVRQAELETLATVYELRGFVEALLATTEIAYWNYVLADRQIAIFQESLEVAKQQRDQTEQRIEVGVLAETQAAAPRAEVALREQALIDARSQRERRRLQLARLINAAGGGLDTAIVATSDPRIAPQPIADLPDRLELAERSRPDLAEAQLRLDQNRLETVVTRNGLLPRLDLFVTLGRSGYDTTLSKSFHDLEGNTYDWVAGLRLSHYIGNRTAEGEHLAARASRRQAVEAVENLRQLVRLDVRLAANEAERARRQIDASAATRRLQQATLGAEKERFDVGAGTALLVSQAQRDLLASRIAEVEAIIGYRIALVQLYLAEGSLLDRRGIQLPAERP